MLATKAELASGAITHCCLRCGLRMFFESPPNRIVAGAPDDVEFDDFLLKEAQAPFGVPSRGWPACQRNQFCLCRAVEYPRSDGVWVVFAGQHRLKPLLDQLVSCPLDIGDAGIQSLGDPAVTPAIASC